MKLKGGYIPIEQELEKFLNFNAKESSVFIPNEIFNDLLHSDMRGSSHIAFSYSYYYLINWLYRYAKYGQIDINTKNIKEILGYNANNKKIDYIIKKNGILDQLNYTFTSTNYPIEWIYNDGCVEFLMLSELDNDTRKIIQDRTGKNYKVKTPVKGLWRVETSRKDGVLDGTFYEVDNTHVIPFEVFIKCMENENVGCIGFYIYSFIKYKCQIFGGSYSVSITQISEQTGIKRRTLASYMDILKGCRFINCDAQDYIIGAEEKERISNTYYINSSDSILNKPQTYIKGSVKYIENYKVETKK